MARTLAGDDSEEIEIPGYKNYYVFTDESGMHKAKYYGFGSLWIPFERRGVFTREFAALRSAHGRDNEMKWTRVSPYTEAFARAIVEWFFKRRWMMFHCIIVPRAKVDLSLHGSLEEAQKKHYSLLLKNKIDYFARGGEKVYRLRVDNPPWRYEKSDEVMQKIVNAQLKHLGENLVRDIRPCDSKRTVEIQVADLILGAVIAAWQGDVESPPKKAVMQTIAHHLGWSDLRHDTHRREWKFNVWHFHDPEAETERIAKTLRVDLKYPQPAYRPSLSKRK